jgi:putative ABC transport system permease protein
MTPPRFARVIARWGLPRDGSGRSVLGDLQQEFDERQAKRGAANARRWYWRQALSICWWSAWAHPLDSHHQPRGGIMFDIIGDLRHAIRGARKAAGQTALIVLTLAIAIGATTIGFSLADTLMLRGLPVSDPDDTVIIFGVDARQPDLRAGIFLGDYLDLRERATTVERLSGWRQARATMVRRGEPYAITVNRVAGDLFGVWGLRLQLGRGLRPDDGRPGAPRVAVLADHYWRQMFAASPNVIGETVMIDSIPHEIVGVVDPAIELGTFSYISLWVPIAMERGRSRDAMSFVVTGRLTDGATVESAAAEFGSIARTLEAECPDTNQGRGTIVLASNRAIGDGNFWIVMAMLVLAVLLVMVIAAANVAGVLLARAVSRQREFGLRVALGARRSRVFRQLALEGLLLAMLGGLGGLAVAEAGLRLMRSVEAEPIFKQIVIDGHEVLFVALLAVVTPLLFSLAPAGAALRTNLTTLLNAGGQRSVGTRGCGRAVLVVAQLALAITLITIGGLVLRTGNAMAQAPAGFDHEQSVIFTLGFDEGTYPDVTARRRLVESVRSRLEQVGGVARAGVLDSFPAVSAELAAPLEIDGRVAVDGQPTPLANVVSIGGATLETLGIPVLNGRGLTDADVESDAPVALVGLEAARRYFGEGTAALGRRLTIRSRGVAREFQIVGITGDARNLDPERGMPPRVWVPMTTPANVGFVVRAAGDPGAIVPAVRHAVRDVVPGVPIEQLETYDRAIERRGGSDRVIMGLLMSFAFVALLFAATGLYGTVAYSASQRRAEFGTRFALGAQVRDVAWLVMGQAFRLLGIGLVLGLAGGLTAASAMRRLWYGVTPLDPFNIAAVVALLGMVTLAASLMPAWKATRVDVVEALRSE